MTAITWKMTVLKKDIVAEVKPSFKAVKKDEPKIGIEQNKKQNE